MTDKALIVFESQGVRITCGDMETRVLSLDILPKYHAMLMQEQIKLRADNARLRELLREASIHIPDRQSFDRECEPVSLKRRIDAALSKGEKP